MRSIWQVCLCVGVLALVVFQAISAPATAQQPFPSPSSAEFVCQVFLYPPGIAPARGTFGFIMVRFFALPDCKGDSVGEGFVFTQGATDEKASPNFLVSEAMLHTYFLMLQRAAGTGQKVTYFRCDDSRTNCIRTLAVHGLDAVAK